MKNKLTKTLAGLAIASSLTLGSGCIISPVRAINTFGWNLMMGERENIEYFEKYENTGTIYHAAEEKMLGHYLAGAGI